MPDIIGHRQDGRFAFQGFANNARKKSGCGLVRFPRSNTNGWESDSDAVKETAATEVGQQQFSDRFLRTVGSQRR